VAPVSAAQTTPIPTYASVTPTASSIAQTTPSPTYAPVTPTASSYASTTQHHDPVIDGAFNSIQARIDSIQDKSVKDTFQAIYYYLGLLRNVKVGLPHVGSQQATQFHVAEHQQAKQSQAPHTAAFQGYRSFGGAGR
jgi:hypothetical protein